MPASLARFVLPAALSLLLIGSAASISRANHIKGTSCGSTVSCAGHEYWPRMTQRDVQKADEYDGSTLRGKKNNNDELLGWHGSDTLYGGVGNDVLWGDHIGDGQPSKQRDVIYGGLGNDFIYSSHGTNVIEAGGGNDAIKTRYGRGRLDCGSGIDIVYIPKSRKSKWRFWNCEKFEYRTESRRGHGIKTHGQ